MGDFRKEFAWVFYEVISAHQVKVVPFGTRSALYSVCFWSVNERSDWRQEFLQKLPVSLSATSEIELCWLVFNFKSEFF